MVDPDDDEPLGVSAGNERVAAIADEDIRSAFAAPNAAMLPARGTRWGASFMVGRIPHSADVVVKGIASHGLASISPDENREVPG
jgi:hypothetical protein